MAGAHETLAGFPLFARFSKAWNWVLVAEVSFYLMVEVDTVNICLKNQGLGAVTGLGRQGAPAVGLSASRTRTWEPDLVRLGGTIRHPSLDALGVTSAGVGQPSTCQGPGCGRASANPESLLGMCTLRGRVGALENPLIPARGSLSRLPTRDPPPSWPCWAHSSDSRPVVPCLLPTSFHV